MSLKTIIWMLGAISLMSFSASANDQKLEYKNVSGLTPDQQSYSIPAPSNWRVSAEPDGSLFIWSSSGIRTSHSKRKSYLQRSERTRYNQDYGGWTEMRPLTAKQYYEGFIEPELLSRGATFLRSYPLPEYAEFQNKLEAKWPSKQSGDDFDAFGSDWKMMDGETAMVTTILSYEKRAGNIVWSAQKIQMEAPSSEFKSAKRAFRHGISNAEFKYETPEFAKNLQHKDILDPVTGDAIYTIPLPPDWQINADPLSETFVSSSSGVKIYPTFSNRYFHNDNMEVQKSIDGWHFMAPMSSGEYFSNVIVPNLSSQGHQFLNAYPVPEYVEFIQKFSANIPETEPKRKYCAIGSDWKTGPDETSMVVAVMSVLEQEDIVVWEIYMAQMEAPEALFKSAKKTLRYGIHNSEIHDQLGNYFPQKIEDFMRNDELNSMPKLPEIPGNSYTIWKGTLDPDPKPDSAKPVDNSVRALRAQHHLRQSRTPASNQKSKAQLRRPYC